MNARPPGRSPKERRGKDQLGMRMAELKALGAFRLLNTGLTACEAMEFTEKANRLPLYTRLERWSTAKKKARSILSKWPAAAGLAN